MSKVLRIGTRKSKLALIQTEIVKQKILSRFPELSVEIIKMSTKGDQDLKRSLASFGGKGVFTKELEEALISGEIDLAVHSAKDMPMAFPKGLGLKAVLDRTDSRDVILTTTGILLKDLPKGAVLGTSSLRRELQAKRINSDLQIKVLRGNVQTRVSKLMAGEYDAIVLAAAGLKRLGMDREEGLFYEYMDPEQFLPAVGQGILAVEGRDGDLEEVLSAIHCPEAAAVLQAERQFLSVIGGGCNAPAAVHTTLEEDHMRMKAMFAENGKNPVYVVCEGSITEAGALGRKVGESILKKPVYGKVTFVGAGPGDAGLITIKGLEAIKRADVIVYDNLISMSLLNEAKEQARLVYAGKRSTHHHLKQESINQVLIDYAKQGYDVVRLKGGDPFIFGRGGEEAMELRKEGIEYVVIPGVSSAYAVPAYAGIPVTHRTCASSLHIITGHESKEKRGNSVLNFDTLAKEEGTLVFLMGLSNLPNIVQQLILHGKDPKTPTAVIKQGTTARQRAVYGSLENIEEICQKNQIQTPAIIVIGDVTAYGKELAWFEKGELFGKRIMATGTRRLAAHLIEEVRKYGGEPIAFSLIDTKRKHMDLGHLNKFTWAVFTSANGVEYFFQALREQRIDFRNLANIKFAVIGSGTKRALLEHGFASDYIPDAFSSEDLAKGLVPMLGKQDYVGLFRAVEASHALPEALKAHGIPFEDLGLYETVMEERKQEELLRQLPQLDYITFGSSSAVKAFAEMIRDYKGPLPKIISIGPVTTKTLRQYGFFIEQTAKVYTVEGMCQAMIEDVRIC
ncbi:hydroxymethylbilane synthase [Anaerostipes sp. 992a]|uniref:hydroxymethylbilane synthase n=1 Tax=Anaerostipes sp. 992a TaxID=1261637 RepID=UPI000951282E|nr:hydroxymethylbilane synthase [Anaerostipes sp. 992a]